VPRSQITNFCKKQPLEEPRALWCTSFTSCAEAFHDGEEILQGAGLLQMMEKNLLSGSSLQNKQRDRSSKKKNNNNNKK